MSTGVKSWALVKGLRIFYSPQSFPPNSYNYLFVVTEKIPAVRSETSLRDLSNASAYIGKGALFSPVQRYKNHLYNAKSALIKNEFGGLTQFEQFIVKTWQSGGTHNHEASMLFAIGVDNVENVNEGVFYGCCNAWNATEKAMLGVNGFVNVLRFIQKEDMPLNPLSPDSFFIATDCNYTARDQ